MTGDLPDSSLKTLIDQVLHTDPSKTSVSPLFPQVSVTETLPQL